MPPSTPADGAPAPAGPLPHDLLELASPAALVCDAPRPAWVDASLARAPLVVVRRARPDGALVPVGVLGAARGERFAAWLRAGDAARRVRPEDLAAARGWRASARPQLALLDRVEAALAALGLAWGPVGSAGFELASGVASLGPSSDLDVLARVPGPLPVGAARRLLAALAPLPVRVDVQLETPAGAVALAEYAAGGPRVVARTGDGPRLVPAPWAAGAAP